MINDHWYVAQQIFTLMNSTHHAIQRISSKAQFVPSSKSESVWDDVKREDQASALAKVKTKIIVPQVGPARQRWGQARSINRSYDYTPFSMHFNDVKRMFS